MNFRKPLFFFFCFSYFGLVLQSFAQETWDAAYDLALDAFNKGQWKVAEEKLKVALEQEPKSDREKRGPGTRPIRYLPDYYLGLVYFNQGRNQEALIQFDKVLQSRILKEIRDPELAMIRSLTNVIKSRPPTDGPRIRNNGPTSEELLEKTGNAINQGKWAEVRKLIESLQTLDPNNPDLAKYKTIFEEHQAKIIPLQKSAMTAFYSGNYSQSIQLWEQVVTEEKDSAKAYFYLACSTAALGFMQENGGSDLLAKAQIQFKESLKIDPNLNYDYRLISPRIQQLYNRSKIN